MGNLHSFAVAAVIGEGAEEGETERSTSIPVTSPLDESGDKHTHIFPNGKYYEKYFYGRTYCTRSSNPTKNFFGGRNIFPNF